MIVYKEKKWLVTDSTGKKVLGTHSSKNKALKQLAAIEISKNSRKEVRESKMLSFKQFLEENTSSTLEYHDELNPKIWDGMQLKKNIKSKLLEIGRTWVEWVGLPESAVEDYILVGGNASYAYTSYSDIDLHILVDKRKIDNCPNLIDDYLKDKKQLWSLTHDISILGHDVEIYAQDIKEAVPPDQGAYSVLNDQWITEPKHQDVDLNDPSIEKKVNEYIEKIDDLISSNAEDESFDKLKEKIRNMRSSGLKKSGEVSIENMVFKELRNRGYLDKMNEYIKSTQDKRLSL
jgi:hypothetical protein